MARANGPGDGEGRLSMTASRLFCFGLGYTASKLARRLLAEGWTVAGTCRSPETQAELRELGFDAFLFGGDGPLDDPEAALWGTTHLLGSVPPGLDGGGGDFIETGETGGDPVGRLHPAGDSYEIEAPEDRPVWVNGMRVTARRLEHRDMIEFGEAGPLSRFRLYREDKPGGPRVAP